MKSYIKSIVVLVCICAVIALILAGTNALTKDIIAENEKAAAQGALTEVLPDGKDFQTVDISKYKLPATVTEIYKASNGGYVFKLTTSGYAPGMIIMCGVNADGTVSGAKCIQSSETLGYEKTYGEKFKGITVNTVDTVDTINSATMTTEGYRSAVKDALNAFAILGGADVDIRTDEEILADNLKTALPSANEKFTRSYANEFIAGDAITACYVADNASGTVYVIGEAFVGVDADGNILQADISAELKATVDAAIAAIDAVSKVDLAQYPDVKTSVVKDVRKAADDSFIFELHAAGYGINGGDDYHPASGKPIVICLSMTADGSIIKCRTMAHEESKGFGDACANPSFYSQFDGKTESNYGNIDAISHATLTTNGYKNAIKRAFETVKILNGGAN